MRHSAVIGERLWHLRFGRAKEGECLSYSLLGWDVLTLFLD
jgi:hypothetical protein